jgi:DegV family protein with EDD domain
VQDDSTLDIPDFIQRMKSVSRGRKTAAPSPQAFYDTFSDCDAVFVITLSQHISGSYASAQTARNMYIEDNGDKPIYIVDSKSASAGEVIIAHKLIELIGEGLAFDEITNKIEEFIAPSTTYFTLECFDTMVDSGRMNGYVAKLASMLNIVPICAGVDGKMALLTQTRGKKKAFAKIAEMMADSGRDTSKLTLAITHVDNAEEAKALAEYLNGKLGFKDIVISEPTGLVCTYADYHGIIVAS